MISCPVKQMSTARRNWSTSNRPSSFWNFIRLSDSRLHAVSSRNTNSLQGLVALMRPVFGTTFQSWIVVSNWRPGSPQIQVASAISLHSSHELIAHADRVVGVLELDRVVRTARHVEPDVVAGVDQRPRLLLFLRLAADELEDVRVVGVEDDHLGRAPSRAA